MHEHSLDTSVQKLHHTKSEICFEYTQSQTLVKTDNANKQEI